MKNRNDIIRRILCVLLVSSMMWGLVSCDSTETIPEETETAAVSTDMETEAETELKPVVAAVDMNGKDVHIMVAHWGSYMPLAITDIMVEELNGEGINDAAFNRNVEMEQNFNCTVSISEEYGGSNKAYDTVIKSVTAGDDTYAFALLRAQQYNALCLSNAFFELSDIPHIDFSKPWWDSKYADAVGIMGKKFGAISDITMNSYLLAGSIYFNKDMIADYSLESPYTLVNEGKWTWDKMFAMADAVDMDLNGDGEYTNEDLYGMTYIDDSPEVLLAAAEVTFAELDPDGIPQVTLYGDSNMTKIMRLSSLLQDKAISYNCHARSKVPSEDEAGMLVRGQTLFCLGGLYYAPEMRLMDQDFGIVPYPKYDEVQSEYHIPMITVALTYVSVPITNSDMENTGIFMEHYAYLGRRDIMPALYDKLLLGKVSRDNESSDMLDIIFNNRVFDTGMIFDFAGLRTNLRVMYNKLKEDFASSFAANEKKVQDNINKLVEQFRALED